MNIDGNVAEYHIHSMKAFGQSLSCLDASEKQIFELAKDEFHLSDIKARTVCKFVSNVHN